MALGYRGNPAWRDMSEYLVHFTRADDGGASARDVLLQIAASQKIEARKRFGAARGLGAPNAEQRCVCFSEIPLDFLERLVQRRESSYGLGFHQTTVSGRGGARVWYVEKGTPLQEVLYDFGNSVVQDHSWDHPWFRMTPFIDYPGEYGGADYQFEWEREWRLAGDLTIGPADLAFVFAPEDDHAPLTADIQAAAQQPGIGAATLMLDPAWGDEQMQAAVQALP